MNIDIRIPMGLMFGIFGLVLTIYGLVSNKEIYTHSLGININLWWGIVMLVFGLIMLLLSRSKNSLSQLNEIKKQDKTQERVNA
jgi:membrane-bound ClpP family serine protease